MTDNAQQADPTTERQLILVVDDDSQMRAAIRAMLEYRGYRVQEAVHGAQALEQLDELRPALIVLDLTMPVLDGVGFVTALRQRGRADDLPILLLSANDDVWHVAAELGLRHYLKKPLRAAALLQVVTQLAPAEG